MSALRETPWQCDKDCENLHPPLLPLTEFNDDYKNLHPQIGFNVALFCCPDPVQILTQSVRTFRTRNNENLPRGVENENATPRRLRAKSNSHFSFKKFLFKK